MMGKCGRNTSIVFTKKLNLRRLSVLISTQRVGVVRSYYFKFGQSDTGPQSNTIWAPLCELSSCLSFPTLFRAFLFCFSSFVSPCIQPSHCPLSLHIMRTQTAGSGRDGDGGTVGMHFSHNREKSFPTFS